VIAFQTAVTIILMHLEMVIYFFSLWKRLRNWSFIAVCYIRYGTVCKDLVKCSILETVLWLQILLGQRILIWIWSGY